MAVEAEGAAADLLDPEAALTLVVEGELAAGDVGGAEGSGVAATGRAELSESQGDRAVAVDGDRTADGVDPIAAAGRQADNLADALGLVP